jgi:hypothetical protein
MLQGQVHVEVVASVMKPEEASSKVKATFHKASTPGKVNL